MYLADTIGAAFEIKSNINTKWQEAFSKIKELKSLNRYSLEENNYARLDDLTIPTYFIAFKGPKKISTIFNQLEAIGSRFSPDGIWIIESGVFYGRIPGGNTVYEVEDPQNAILAFTTVIYKVLNNYSKNQPDLNRYHKLL
ncbi:MULTISPECIES: hypothetical protein [unclassified Sphingobacterium]|uniref:hypothetical protein n=1 Tax=unclassified Sphingobacterium TaxID=2609468 RepID=UPI0025E50EAD|nr:MULTISPECIES: hypothetical protein [unclassified Sphingobacterium]